MKEIINLDELKIENSSITISISSNGDAYLTTLEKLNFTSVKFELGYKLIYNYFNKHYPDVGSFIFTCKGILYSGCKYTNSIGSKYIKCTIL